jgi:hypothetical protein
MAVGGQFSLVQNCEPWPAVVYKSTTMTMAQVLLLKFKEYWQNELESLRCEYKDIVK